MTTRDVLAGLSERMEDAVDDLNVERADAVGTEWCRLLGKADGVELARSYVSDALRTLPDDEVTTAEQLDALPSLTIIGVAYPHQPEKLCAVQKRCDGQWGSYKVDGTRPASWLVDTAAHQPFRARVLWRPEGGAQ